MMAIEKRGNRHYYYRKQRVGEHVISEYVGGGDLAELGARLAQQERNRCRRRHRSEKAERQRLAKENQMIQELSGLVLGLAKVALVGAGYYTHKGCWRKKRHGKNYGK